MAAEVCRWGEGSMKDLVGVGMVLYLVNTHPGGLLNCWSVNSNHRGSELCVISSYNSTRTYMYVPEGERCLTHH